MRSRDWIGWSAALAGVMVVTSSAIAKPRKHVLRPYQVVWRAIPDQSYQAYAWAPATRYYAPPVASSPRYGWPEIQAARAMVRRP
jgi:hypothetical protein